MNAVKILTAVFLMIAIPSGLVYWYTFVERKVFEQSYQRQEGLKAEIATYEASLVEIEALLNGNTVEQSKRELLENQKIAITVRLNTAKKRLHQ